MTGEDPSPSLPGRPCITCKDFPVSLSRARSMLASISLLHRSSPVEMSSVASGLSWLRAASKTTKKKELHPALHTREQSPQWYNIQSHCNKIVRQNKRAYRLPKFDQKTQLFTVNAGGTTLACPTLNLHHVLRSSQSPISAPSPQHLRSRPG